MFHVEHSAPRDLARSELRRSPLADYARIACVHATYAHAACAGTARTRAAYAHAACAGAARAERTRAARAEC